LKNSTKDIFITAKPISEKLSKYISYYYFHSSKEESYNKSFEFYPNYKHALTAYKNSQITIQNKGTLITPTEKSNIPVLYSINKNRNFKVEINGSFQKIGVVFNPLGINHFIDKDLEEIFSGEINNFTYFEEELNKVLKKVFYEDKTDKKVKLLDDFFEKKYVGFSENSLQKAIQEIITSHGTTQVTELSKKINVNRRTLLRLFKKHTTLTIKEYQKLVRFRQAFNYFNENKKEINLTDVALYSMYYDQAHFIKHFKSITKETPKTLLYKISHIGKEDTYWYFKE